LRSGPTVASAVCDFGDIPKEAPWQRLVHGIWRPSGGGPARPLLLPRPNRSTYQSLQSEVQKMPYTHGSFLSKSILVLVALAVPTAVQAQAPAQPAGPAPDQEELAQFTELYVDVTEIQMEMQAEVAGAQTSEEANAIQQEAIQEIGQAMQEHDFTEERYSEIIGALNQDAGLREEFDAMLQSATGAAVPN
jgi:hypothetical protein